VALCPSRIPHELNWGRTPSRCGGKPATKHLSFSIAHSNQLPRFDGSFCFERMPRIVSRLPSRPHNSVVKKVWGNCPKRAGSAFHWSLLLSVTMQIVPQSHFASPLSVHSLPKPRFVPTHFYLYQPKACHNHISLTTTSTLNLQCVPKPHFAQTVRNCPTLMLWACYEIFLSSLSFLWWNRHEQDDILIIHLYSDIS
jgi:hypothetical protein